MKENFIEKDGIDIVKSCYKGFAEYANKTRALPDYRDGLKAVNRKIFYSMYIIGAKGGVFKKCLAIQGNAMKFYVHGDASLLGALYNLVRYSPFIQGQGNFGLESTIIVEAAAPRYTEVSLNTKFDKFMFNYVTESKMILGPLDELEPEYLLMHIPHALISSTMGIGTGIATRIPTFKIKDLANAAISVLNQTPFPTLVPYKKGNLCVSSKEDIKRVSETGCGSIKFEIDYGYDKTTKILTLKGMPAGRMTLKTVVDRLVDKFQLEYNDLSSEDGIKVEMKVKPFARGAIPLEKLARDKEFKRMLTYSESFSSHFVDAEGKAGVYSPEMLIRNAVSQIIDAYSKKYDKLKRKLLHQLLNYRVIEAASKKGLFKTQKAKSVLEKELHPVIKYVSEESQFRFIVGEIDYNKIISNVLSSPISNLTKDLSPKIDSLKASIKEVNDALKHKIKNLVKEYQELSGLK